jgi:hypothetical protein
MKTSLLILAALLCGFNLSAPPITTTLTLDRATNWTGHVVGTNELGYVVTNHTAHLVYQGATNHYQLKSVPTDIAVWRESQVRCYITNYNYKMPLVITNHYLLNPQP